MICPIYFTPNKSQSARSHANSNTIYAFFIIFKTRLIIFAFALGQFLYVLNEFKFGSRQDTKT